MGPSKTTAGWCRSDWLYLPCDVLDRKGSHPKLLGYWPLSLAGFCAPCTYLVAPKFPSSTVCTAHYNVHDSFIVCRDPEANSYSKLKHFREQRETAESCSDSLLVLVHEWAATCHSHSQPSRQEIITSLIPRNRRVGWMKQKYVSYEPCVTLVETHDDMWLMLEHNMLGLSSLSSKTTVLD